MEMAKRRDFETQIETTKICIQSYGKSYLIPN